MSLLDQSLPGYTQSVWRSWSEWWNTTKALPAGREWAGLTLTEGQAAEGGVGTSSWGSAETFSLQQGWITQKVKANGWRCSECECGEVWGLHFTDTSTTRGVNADLWWLKSVMKRWHDRPRKRLFCSHAASRLVHVIKYFCFFHTLLSS